MALSADKIAEMDAALTGATQAPQGGALDMAAMDKVAGLSEPGMLTRIGNDYDQRLQNLEQIDVSNIEGKSGTAHKFARQAAQGLGMAGDVGGEAVKSLMETAGEGLKFIHPSLYEGLTSAKDLAGKLIEPAAALVKEKYRHVVPAGSEADLDINALGNTVAGLSTVIPAAQGIKAAAPVVGEIAGDVVNGIKAAPGAAVNAAKAAGTAVNDAKTAIQNKFKPSDIASVKELETEAHKAFGYADKVGGIQPPSVRNSMLDEMQQVYKKTDEHDDDAVFRKALDKLESNRGKPLTLSAAHGIDKNLNELIGKEIDVTGRMSPTGYRLEQLQDILRDHTYGAAPKSVIGGNQGSLAWAEGNRLWQKKYQMTDVENIFRGSEFAKNPKEFIQKGFERLARNPKKFKNLPPDIQADVEAAAKGSIPANLLSKLSSSLLTVIGAAVHGVPGAIAGEAVNLAASKGASALQMAKANKVARSISKNGKFVEPPAPAAPLLLPAPGSGTSFYADALGNVSRTPNPANEIVAGQPRPIVGAPADVVPPAQPPEPPNQLLLSSPESFQNLQVDRMGNVIRANPGQAEGFKTLQDILRMSPENARKYLNSLKGKKQ